MAISIRPADLSADRAIMVEALGRYLSKQCDGRRFEWLYRQCPHGEARAWIAYDETSDKLLGTASAFPRRMYVGGELRNGYVLGDFLILPEFRTLGPALRLQRACLEVAKPGGPGICYDFPAAAMVPVYKRLAIEPQEQFVRMAKPLRTDRVIQRRVKPPRLARALSALGNRVIEVRDLGRKQSSHCAIALHEGPCGEEFSTLAGNVKGNHGVCVERSSEYLNWRYRSHFLNTYELITARLGNALKAYAVYKQEGENAEIVDLFGTNESAVLSDLIRGIATLARQRDVISLSASMLASHPRVVLFKRLGFYPRESCPVFVCPQSSPVDGASASGLAWFLMQGDRES